MEKSSHAPAQPTLNARGGSRSNKHTPSLAEQSTVVRGTFLNMALNMTWQLAIVVLVPILAGVKLDKDFKTGSTCTFIGLGLALLGSIAVMWRTLQVANRLPVPKLSAEQKRAIQKSYDMEDKDE
jgi:Putative F0F1-ATPase subunit Ca2+/Mg2+ transporter